MWPKASGERAGSPGAGAGDPGSGWGQPCLDGRAGLWRAAGPVCVHCVVETQMPGLGPRTEQGLRVEPSGLFALVACLGPRGAWGASKHSSSP